MKHSVYGGCKLELVRDLHYQVRVCGGGSCVCVSLLREAVCGCCLRMCVCVCGVGAWFVCVCVSLLREAVCAVCVLCLHAVCMCGRVCADTHRRDFPVLLTLRYFPPLTLNLLYIFMNTD